MLERREDENIYDWQTRLAEYQLSLAKQAMVAEIGFCVAVFVFVAILVLT